MGIKIKGEEYTEEQLKKAIMSGVIIIGKVPKMYDMNNIIKEKEDYIKKRVHKRKI